MYTLVNSKIKWMSKKEVNTINFSVDVKVYPNVDELPEDYKLLLEEAYEAKSRAYAPYSNFKVGACLLLNNGEKVSGNNQENAAYPSGLCAERTAFFSYGASGNSSKVKAVAVVAGSEAFRLEGILSPCGSCRQVMAEYEHKQNQLIEVILKSDSDEIYILPSIASTLPFAFQCEFLKKE